MNDQETSPTSTASTSSSFSDPIAASPPLIPTSPATFGNIDKLTKIEIENYRAFRGHFELNILDGFNAIIYGENGAGKSSLFNALVDFFESPDRTFYDGEAKYTRHLKHDDYRHRYNNGPASVRLSFNIQPPAGGGALPLKVYEWSNSKNDPKDRDIRTVDKGKGSLDYRSLLRVHFLRSGQREINLFELFIGPILSQYKNPVSSPGRTFADEWNRIKSAFMPRVWKPSNLEDMIREFNAGFGRVAIDTVALASVLLADFDSDLSIEIDFTPATYTWRPKKLVPPKIIARPTFRRMKHGDYYIFLNEARLSALALTLYLAGLKNSPATGFRILLLDDVLIGLDMANRMTVLNIIEKHFNDWQVFIFTYSKAWFEILKDSTKSWGNKWTSVILRSEAIGAESPVIIAEGSGDALEMANKHLQRKDYKAAAVYARSALEAICHRICAEAHVRVIHVEKPKMRTLEHLICALKPRLEELADDARRRIALELIVRLEQARSFVLNRNAHFDIEEEDTLSAEVGTAIKAVMDFQVFLAEQSWGKEFFRSGAQMSDQEQIKAQLNAARELVGNGANRQCQAALKAAHRLIWHVYGKKLGVLVPLGSDISESIIWKAADGQGKLLPDIKTRLEAVKGYLYGGIKISEFDNVKFEEAAKLLEELALISV